VIDDFGNVCIGMEFFCLSCDTNNALLNVQLIPMVSLHLSVPSKLVFCLFVLFKGDVIVRNQFRNLIDYSHPVNFA